MIGKMGSGAEESYCSGFGLHASKYYLWHLNFSVCIAFWRRRSGHDYPFVNSCADKKAAPIIGAAFGAGGYFDAAADAAVAPTTTVPVVDILRGCAAASTEGALAAGVAVAAGTLLTGAGVTDAAADADSDSGVEVECPAASAWMSILSPLFMMTNSASNAKATNPTKIFHMMHLREYGLKNRKRRTVPAFVLQMDCQYKSWLACIS